MFTTTEIVRVQQPPLPAVIPAPEVQDRLADLWAERKSANTRRGYASDWRQFEGWCVAAGHQAMPASAQVLSLYLDHLMTDKTPRGNQYAAATIGRHVAAIAHMHNERGAADPTKDRVIVGLMEGVRRRLAGRPSAAKAALRVRHLKKGLRHEPTRPIDVRNRALLLLGFAGGFRRSELVGIDVEHLSFSEEGAVRVTLPTSKTDQRGEGRTIWVLRAGQCCPVRALRAWIELSGITTGPLFRPIDRHKRVKSSRLSADAVPHIVKNLCRGVGLDPKEFSGHSLRSGLVTESFALELPIELIQQQTGHRTVDVLMRYRREANAAKRNVSDRLGL